MSERRDVFTAAVLVVLTWATRIPFVGSVFYHWDSINFAFALDRFDIASSQPHPPGYLLYVLLGRLVRLFVPDAQQALAGISWISSGLAVGSLYLLGARLFERRVALLAALLLASSPLYWFYGELALPHALDAFVIIACIGLFWSVGEGNPRSLIPGAIWLAIAGGLRPQTQVFLAPAVAFLVWKGARRSAAVRSRLVVAFVVMVVVDLLWAVPMVRSCGGLRAYLAITEAEHLKLGTTTSILSGGGLWGLRRNGLKLGMYTLYGWSAGLALFALGCVWRGREAFARVPRDVWILFVLWVLPSIVFYEFIHMGQQGLVFVFFPAICLLSAVALAPIEGPALLLAAAAVVANAAIFLLAPTFPLGGDRPKLLTVDTLRRQDAFYFSRNAAVRRRFDPRSTVILSAIWRFPQYYLSEYRLVPYSIVSRWELGEGSSRIHETEDLGPRQLGVQPDDGGDRYAVILDDELLPFAGDAAGIEWLDLHGDGRLGFLRLRRGEGLRLEPEAIRVTPPRDADDEVERR